ncbi:hypothetical protein NEOLEDRAFT_797645 [Neolentinus lepideus HHB14362 ss-1]|uniref:Uncharacterized protein n=1 Tax=Neolentinus lepideus HHB14362 ss-1 TaxID=1314782 RepID=A0A165PH87_9AGAM|nr:hypothetical protein NEOLEDRAFT_797645 [Neolentinus lepideus HHB14362 ss-1]
MREELQKDIEDTRDIISSLFISTTSIANHSVAAAPFVPADPDTEDDNWEVEVERCAQKLVEAERPVEEGTSESEVAHILLSKQSVAATRPILRTDVVNVYEDRDSWQPDFREHIARGPRGAQAIREADQRFEESIPEAESNAPPPSDPQAAVESPLSDVEDLSVFPKPDLLRNLAAIDPTVLCDRDYPPEHNLLDFDWQRGMQTHGSFHPIHALYQSAQWQPLNNTEPPFSHLSVSDSF